MSKIGWNALNPLSDFWLMTSGSDWTPDYMAWMFYRKAEWGFPLGVFTGYSYPETVSIGLTGAIPLFAVPFKLISGILPNTFQYFGIWLLMCYILQAVFGYKLLQAIGVKDKINLMLGACFMVLSYSMLDRIAHMNLCAHWQILAGLYLYFGEKNPNKALWKHGLLIMASVWTHPYLIIFTMTISWAHFLRFWLENKLTMLKGLLFILGSFVFTFTAWILIGNHVLDSSQAVGEGFGIFSANLNTFWTPKTSGPIMPAHPRYYETQFEGVAYMGIGVLLVVLFIPYLSWKYKFSWKLDKSKWAILALAICLFILALSNQVTFNEYLILYYKLPNFIMEKLGILRASGRYVWLLHYLLMISFVLFIDRMGFHKKWKYIILSAVIVLNIIDFWPQLKQNKYTLEYHPVIKEFKEDIWTDIIADAEDFIMHPAHERNYNAYADDMMFARVAGLNDQKFNSGHLARFNFILREKYKKGIKDTIMNHPMFYGNKTIITGEQFLPDFNNLLEANQHELFEINGYYSFVPKIKSGLKNPLIDRLITKGKELTKTLDKEEFSEFLDRNKGNTMLFAVMDDASSHMIHCPDIISFSQNNKAIIHDLNFRESYIGIYDGEKMIFEKRGVLENGTKGIAQKDTSLQFIIEGEKIKKVIEMFSADNDNGNKARIFVGNKDYAINDRGLNIVVLDRSGEVVESTRFDTYMMCHHFSEKSALFYKLWSIK